MKSGRLIAMIFETHAGGVVELNRSEGGGCYARHIIEGDGVKDLGLIKPGALAEHRTALARVSLRAITGEEPDVFDVTALASDIDRLSR